MRTDFLECCPLERLGGELRDGGSKEGSNG